MPTHLTGVSVWSSQSKRLYKFTMFLDCSLSGRHSLTAECRAPKREEFLKVKEIDHICFAVRSVNMARKVYEELLGLEPSCEYVAREESIRVIRYYVGSVAVEIMEPTNATCEVARFLDNKGEGLFLVSYRVEDVEKALDELHLAGRKTIDRKPRCLMGNRYAFIDPPGALHGVLTEILDGEFIAPTD
jgi:methylmalonyl-CoA/ethylmalonyl-CoA epimerase